MDGAVVGDAHITGPGHSVQVINCLSDLLLFIDDEIIDQLILTGAAAGCEVSIR